MSREETYDMAGADVAVLGIGRMGAAIVQRLAGAGLRLAVWNRSPDAARRVAGDRVTAFEDPHEAVRGARFVCTVLFDGPAVKEVLIDRKVLASMAPGADLVDLTTMDLASSREIAGAAEAAGIGYVRAAVSGTPAVVLGGNATIIASGPSECIDRARPLLSHLTSKLVLVGDDEQARIVKLAINSVLGVMTQALAESVVLSEATGVPRETLLDALDESVAASPFLRYKAAALRARSYEATFSTDGMRKDLALAAAEGRDRMVPLPVTTLVGELLERARAAGYGELDFLALVPLLQADSGRVPDVPAPARQNGGGPPG